jgi:ribosomal protein S18 acetylase RimI-like enzyme
MGEAGGVRLAETTTEFSGFRFVLMATPSPKDKEYIHEQIKAFNDERSPHHRAARQVGAQTLDIFIRDREGHLCGGLVGKTYWDWLEVEDLWLGSSLRGQGIGRRLVLMAEAEARARGCAHIWLSTFGFQARGFYEKLGYRVVGTLEDYPPGDRLYWMRKEL